MTQPHDLILQRPAADTLSPELLLLFHGVGSNADDLRALGEALAELRPQAWVVSVQASNKSGLGRGWEWFSVQGVTEANRPERVAAAMPRFAEAVRGWQVECGIGPHQTVLIGFSQGAIMALESTQQAEPPAARVVALAGRFAQPPRVAPADVRLHLLHGEQDPVMPRALADAAAQNWRTLGGQVTLDLFPGLGHGIDARVLQRVAEHLAAASP